MTASRPMLLLVLACLGCGARPSGEPPLEPLDPAQGHPAALVAHSCAAVDGVVYVLGGIDAGNTRRVEHVLRFDPAADPQTAWRRGARMPAPASFVGVCAHDGLIYALGGATREVEFLDAARVYDPRSDRWATLPPMPTPRSRFPAVALDGRIYALGGLGPDGPGGLANLSTVEAFDPATGRWTSVAPMRTGRHGHAAVVLNGCIIVMGGSTGPGFDRTAECERYDPATRAWTSLPSMNRPRLFFGATAHRGGLVVFGDHARISPVETWTPGETAWRATDIMLARARFAWCTIGGRVLLLGGEGDDAEARPLDWLTLPDPTSAATAPSGSR